MRKLVLMLVGPHHLWKLVAFNKELSLFVAHSFAVNHEGQQR